MLAGANPVAASAAFFWQCPGSMFPWLLAIFLTLSNFSTTTKWKILLAQGALFSFAVVVLTYVEASSNPRTVATDQRMTKSNNMNRVNSKVFVRSNFIKLIGTGGSWFIFDVCYYGVGLFGGDILSSINDSVDDVTSDANVIRVAWEQLLALGMGIPAVLLTIYLMGKGMSLKNLQIYGFILTAVAFFIMAVCFGPLRDSNTERVSVVRVAVRTMCHHIRHVV